MTQFPIKLKKSGYANAYVKRKNYCSCNIMFINKIRSLTQKVNNYRIGKTQLVSRLYPEWMTHDYVLE